MKVQEMRDGNALLDFFRSELKAAFDSISIKTSDHTEAYLVHLLGGFVRLEPDDLDQMGFAKPAAILLGEAMNTPGERRIEAYRRLGDASLFNCGFFDEHLTRRNIPAGYYHQVGRVAYQNLSDLMRFKGSNGGMFQQIFDELAARFDEVVAAFKRLGGSEAVGANRRSAALIERLRRGETLSADELAELEWLDPDGSAVS